MKSPEDRDLRADRPFWARLLREEHGATAIEYALLAALIGVVVAGSLSALSSTLELMWDLVADEVDKVSP